MADSIEAKRPAGRANTYGIGFAGHRQRGVVVVDVGARGRFLRIALDVQYGSFVHHRAPVTRV